MTAVVSRLLDPKRAGEGDQVPRQALPLVRFGRYKERLELVVECDGLWSTLRESERPGTEVIEEIGDEMEGALAVNRHVCFDTNLHVSTGI